MAQKQRLTKLDDIAKKDWEKYANTFNEFNSRYKVRYDFVKDRYYVTNPDPDRLPSGESFIIRRVKKKV